MLKGPSNVTEQGAAGQRASALVTSHPGVILGVRTATVSLITSRWSMLSATGLGGFWIVSPGTSDLATGVTLTLGPGLTLVRSMVTTTLFDVTLTMVSARPFTVIVALLGGWITTRPAAPT